jgi:hypothetical protein
VLRSTGMGTSARVTRRAGLAGVLIALVCALAASSALADRRPQPNADELWRSYPLEQKPTKTAPAPAAGAPRRGSTPAPAADGGSSDGPPWALLAAIALASAALVGVVAARRRRRPAAAHSPAGAPPPLWPDWTAAADDTSTAPVGARAAAAAATTVASRPAPTQPSPARRPPPSGAAAAGPNGRPPGTRQGPVCQIKWSRRTRRFHAYATDEDGSERRVARSAVIDWDQPGPPEETPEARAAIRRLTKDLRDGGWRPLRARGIDFRERRWYARRFRWPTEAEAEPAGDGETPDREIAGRPGGEL